MKFPKKQIPFALAVLGMAFFASVSAFAKPAAPPKAAEVPAYMAQAAKLADVAYLACIKSKMKLPAVNNIVENYQSTLACQKDSKG